MRVSNLTENRSRPGRTVSSVLGQLVAEPRRMLVRDWNWKSALCSSLFRSSVFFGVNVTAGVEKALGAMATEFVFRSLTAGWYGAVTQAFRRVRPMWKAVATVLPILVVVQHSLEFLVHWLRGTPRLSHSIGASIAFTLLSTIVNLALMRRGSFVVGEDARSLREDLAGLPRLIVAALFCLGTGLRRMAAGLPGQIQRS